MYDGPPRPSVLNHGLSTASESHPTTLISRPMLSHLSSALNGTEID